MMNMSGYSLSSHTVLRPNLGGILDFGAWKTYFSIGVSRNLKNNISDATYEIESQFKLSKDLSLIFKFDNLNIERGSLLLNYFI